jgi:CheY-like chemotaxis protein
MYRIVIVSSKPESFSVLAGALQADSRIAVEMVASGDQALALLISAAPNLVILDEKAGGPSDLEFVRSIMQRNALIDVIVVSRLSEKEFHEASEGLGILMQLPPRPGLPEAEALLARLTLVSGKDFEREVK